MSTLGKHTRSEDTTESQIDAKIQRIQPPQTLESGMDLKIIDTQVAQLGSSIGHYNPTKRVFSFLPIKQYSADYDGNEPCYLKTPEGMQAGLVKKNAKVGLTEGVEYYRVGCGDTIFTYDPISRTMRCLPAATKAYTAEHDGYGGVCVKLIDNSQWHTLQYSPAVTTYYTINYKSDGTIYFKPMNDSQLHKYYVLSTLEQGLKLGLVAEHNRTCIMDMFNEIYDNCISNNTFTHKTKICKCIEYICNYYN